MNRTMQKCIAWHPLGIPGETLQGGQTAVSDLTRQMSRRGHNTVATSVTFLTIDQSESCGHRRNARVIIF